MPRVLLIASDFPPNLTIAARRPFGLSRYLSECGWDPIVLTIRDTNRIKADYPGIHLIESDPLAKPRLVRKLLDIFHARQEATKSNDPHPMTNSHYHDSSVERFWITKLRKILFYPDRYFLSWYPTAVKEYLQLAKDIPVHAIISTLKPFTTHIIAKHIKSRIHAPWIADFRDLWPHWRFFQVDDYYNKTTNVLNRILLSKVLTTADAIVAVTQPQKLLLERRFPTKSVYNIPNGFDPAEYTGMTKLHISKFLLTYTGQVRTDCQDPEILFKAISRLIQKNFIDKSIIRLRFYGEVTNKLLSDIEKYQITDIVEATGVRRPRDEIITKQLESSLLVLFAALDPQNTGTATGKIYRWHLF
jgi:glycosyltransferase involved in cell wall biosynthesis